MENLTLNDSWRWRLEARTRKGVLVVHVASAGSWIGIDVVMGVLVFTALLAENGDIKALCYRALELFAVWPLITTGLLCLASGVVLGLGTNQEIHDTTRREWGLIPNDSSPINSALYPLRRSEGGPSGAELGR
jgi:hypothetical protein